MDLTPREAAELLAAGEADLIADARAAPRTSRSTPYGRRCGTFGVGRLGEPGAQAIADSRVGR
jgi:hypothetical protein